MVSRSKSEAKGGGEQKDTGDIKSCFLAHKFGNLSELSYLLRKSPGSLCINAHLPVLVHRQFGRLLNFHCDTTSSYLCLGLCAAPIPFSLCTLFQAKAMS